MSKIIIVGKSCTGKTTLASKLLKEIIDSQIIVYDDVIANQAHWDDPKINIIMTIQDIHTLRGKLLYKHVDHTIYEYDGREEVDGKVVNLKWIKKEYCAKLT